MLSFVSFKATFYLTFVIWMFNALICLLQTVFTLWLLQGLGLTAVLLCSSCFHIDFLEWDSCEEELAGLFVMQCMPVCDRYNNSVSS